MFRGYQLFPDSRRIASMYSANEWYAVLMIDGSKGWIKKSEVELMSHPIQAKKVAHPDGTNRNVTGKKKLVDSALQYLGKNFEQDSDGDFVKTVFAKYGVILPATAKEQGNVGKPVTYAELQPGDRLYFCYKHSYLDHCGIYIGQNRFVHYSSEIKKVKVDVIEGKHAQALICAMR